MHLWPTKNLRDSFKLSYLKNLEWNYQRMEKDKQRQSSTQQKLLEQDNNNYNVVDTPQTGVGGAASVFHELLLIFSCCYCCFCCGACVEEK